LQKSNVPIGPNYDRILEHRTRLGICVLLSQHDQLSFSRFKELLSETDGNLGAQLKKLEESKYIEVEKAFVERKPVSWYSITKTGKNALRKHIAALEQMIASIR
jgi:DNA-binding MarR family transcriptional regulator